MHSRNLLIGFEVSPRMTLQNTTDWRKALTKSTWHNALYCVGVPLLVGFFIGWGQSPVPELTSHLTTAFYFTGFILIGWLCCIGTMMIGKKVLAPWRPPLWVLSILPPLVIGWLALIPMNYYLEITNALLPPDRALLKPLPIELTSGFLQDYVLSMVSVVILFCGTNYLFQFLGLKQFGYGGDQTEAPPVSAINTEQVAFNSLPFMSLLPKSLRGEPLSIQAQEHYIHVRTIHGSELIKYPFGNAVKSLDGFPGLQVHRSYWVGDRAVVRITKVAQRHFIEMDNGEQVPISQTYLKSAREHFADHFTPEKGPDHLA